MGRDWSTDLQTIHQAYRRRDTLDIYLNDDTVKRLSRGAVQRGGTTYLNYIRSVGDLRFSLEKAIDRIEIVCQNVNSELGFDLASNLRLLDHAIANYGRIYQSARNSALIEDIPMLFRGVLADGQVDEENFRFEFIVDYESLGAIMASRGLSPRCWWQYKNGIECTSTSGEPDCPKTRAACIERGKEWEFGGVEFFEEPTSTPPGTGGGGGIGGGTCFTGETPVWTPDGEIPIREMWMRFDEGKKSVFSFNPDTGEVIEDEIENIWYHEKVSGYFTLMFDDRVLNVTPEHRLLTDFGQFTCIDDLQRTDTSKAFVGQEWQDLRLEKIKWNSDVWEKVWNLEVKKNKTYFANRMAVSNSKNPGEL